jgi:hypothetical protein
VQIDHRLSIVTRSKCALDTVRAIVIRRKDRQSRAQCATRGVAAPCLERFKFAVILEFLHVGWRSLEQQLSHRSARFTLARTAIAAA